MGDKRKIGIIGGGPAGLTAAYELVNKNYDVIVFEQDENYVGGISRTETYKGFHFDIGGHRFFTKSKEVDALWQKILGPDLLRRNRKSRILYQGKFYSYPLKTGEALSNLGVWTTLLCLFSYLKARIFPISEPSNFEQWVTNKFGAKLFHIFFKTYTEKVWGMKCEDISVDWAAQRIKGLSMGKAILDALFRSWKNPQGDNQITSLIESFWYPRKGPGMLWEKCARDISDAGGVIKMGCSIMSLEKKSKWELLDQHGERFVCDEIISSMPLKQLVQSLIPKVPESAIKASQELNYRDFFTVILMVECEDLFDDNWLYVHDPSVKVGRIQNFKAWSPEMVPDEKYNCYGLEYFCFERESIWSKSDDELISLGKNELAKLGLLKNFKIVDGYIARQAKAYPIYNENYKDNLDTIKDALQHYEGLQVVGRNGMHKYNNQDHSMMTAILATKNIINGELKYNLWNVNSDAEYHETKND